MSAATHDIQREVRFAIVMYGGVSLAIYINGVSQEIFDAVRATSPGAGPAAASSTARVYRSIAHLLSDESLLEAYNAWLAGPREPEANPLRIAEQRNPLKTRFIVDIISGTSAGGINGIFLAKALANDQPFERLKQLWLDEAEIDLLLNDDGSLRGLDGALGAQKPPKSLLNSQRMYRKLVEALEAMEGGEGAVDKGPSPHVSELDLFITTTDIEGSVVPIQLSDRIVHERRHRCVFHLRYTTPEATGEAVNDFVRSHNPFLAFAARCTSSFPFAFEPMRLHDIDEVLKNFPPYRNQEWATASYEAWRSYLPDAQDPANTDYLMRPHGDGGYLDNKPFSYATRLLARRHADVPVDRKLIYVEPSPEHPEREPRKGIDGKWPDALDNVTAALISIPGYETIREDLQFVLERNRRLARVQRITQRVEADIDRYLAAGAGSPAWLRRGGTRGDDWDHVSLSDMIKDYGPFYLPYRRLRVGAVTDDLSAVIVKALKLDPDSDDFYAIRSLVRAWRDTMFVDDVPEAGNSPDDRRQTSNFFLNHFDVEYRMRRLHLMRRKVSAMRTLVEDLIAGRPPTGLRGEGAQILETFRSAPTEDVPPVDFARLERPQLTALRDYLSSVQVKLDDCNRRARRAQRDIRSGHAERAARLGLQRWHIAYLLGVPEKQAREIGSAARSAARSSPVDPARTQWLEEGVQQASDLFLDPVRFGLPEDLVLEFLGLIAELSRDLDRCIELFRESANEIELFREEGEREMPLERRAVKALLRRCYLRFEIYDQISFPILYDTDAAMSDFVEVIRISPEDAPSLIDELEPGENRRKLAGTALHHFGAFLDRGWRKNDVMWGRLDGAERLIDALLPGEPNAPVRAALRADAHHAILDTEMGEEARREFLDLVGSAWMQVAGGTGLSNSRLPEVRQSVVERLRALGGKRNPLLEVLERSLQPDQFRDYVKQHYEVERELDPKVILRTTARSVRVTGRLLDGIAEERGLESRALDWLARLGSIATGIVELAVPQSLWALLAVRWLSVLYAIEAVILVGATLFSLSSALHLGWALFGLTAGTHLVLTILNEYMKGPNRGRKVLLLVAGLVVLVLASVGVGLLMEMSWALKTQEVLRAMRATL